MVPLFAYLARCCVGVSFLLSAAWKVRHRLEFEAALPAALRIPGLRRTLRFVVPAAEMITAGVLLAPARLGTFGAVAGGGLVVVLGSTLLRLDLSAGCGCWSANGYGPPAQFSAFSQVSSTRRPVEALTRSLQRAEAVASGIRS